jgi:hypothetical protein
MWRMMVKGCVHLLWINEILKRAFHNETDTYHVYECAPAYVCTCVCGCDTAHEHVCVCVCVCVVGGIQSWVSHRERHEEPREIYFPFKSQGTFKISLTLIKPTPGSWTWWTFILKSNLACQTSFFPSSHFIVFSSRGPCFKGYDQSKGHFFWDIFYID